MSRAGWIAYQCPSIDRVIELGEKTGNGIADAYNTSIKVWRVIEDLINDSHLKRKDIIRALVDLQRWELKELTDSISSLDSEWWSPNDELESVRSAITDLRSLADDVEDVEIEIRRDVEDEKEGEITDLEEKIKELEEELEEAQERITELEGELENAQS